MVRLWDDVRRAPGLLVLLLSLTLVRSQQPRSLDRSKPQIECRVRDGIDYSECIERFQMDVEQWALTDGWHHWRTTYLRDLVTEANNHEDDPLNLLECGEECRPALVVCERHDLGHQIFSDDFCRNLLPFWQYECVGPGRQRRWVPNFAWDRIEFPERFNLNLPEACRNLCRCKFPPVLEHEVTHPSRNERDLFYWVSDPRRGQQADFFDDG
ncbi:MAG: hypothetical protein M1837_001575 [Sclerophora amabilis]|nr:MAG: hypothetical protein M1837_001575 [Sclerophora amabilis]